MHAREKEELLLETESKYKSEKQTDRKLKQTNKRTVRRTDKLPDRDSSKQRHPGRKRERHTHTQADAENRQPDRPDDLPFSLCNPSLSAGTARIPCQAGIDCQHSLFIHSLPSH